MEWILNERSGIYFERSEPCRSYCKQTIQQQFAATENRYKFARSLLVHMSILWRSERKERVNKIYLCTSNISVLYVSYVCCVYLFLFPFGLRSRSQGHCDAHKTAFTVQRRMHCANASVELIFVRNSYAPEMPITPA